ncbi:hypothetical protein [Salinispira pacifica]|uniref:J domain-containing protein n=1 Tax=Salinispira pacifica TaxID=1307761 RepID=V5WL09_9SPIO|nr:hypothetical protein [Salinispira pacifica]AHC16335.1 hypothetical protein L21SP2_2989 [Salinispira pacifica]
MGILVEKVRSGEIRSRSGLEAAFRQLSKRYHPDTSGLDHRYFVSICMDRDDAIILLEEYAAGSVPGEQDSPKADTDFWYLYYLYSSRMQYQHKDRDGSARLTSELIASAGSVSDEFMAGIFIYTKHHSTTNYADMYSIPTCQQIHMGMANFLEWKERSSGDTPAHIIRRSYNIARTMLSEAEERLGKPAGEDYLHMYPLIRLALLDLSRGQISNSRPPVPEDLYRPLYTLACRLHEEWNPDAIPPDSSKEPLRQRAEWIRKALIHLGLVEKQYAYIRAVFSPDTMREIRRFKGAEGEIAVPEYYGELLSRHKKILVEIQEMSLQRQRLLERLTRSRHR